MRTFALFTVLHVDVVIDDRWLVC